MFAGLCKVCLGARLLRDIGSMSKPCHACHGTGKITESQKNQIPMKNKNTRVKSSD